MPGQKPRLTFTPSPAVFDAVQRIAGRTGETAAKIVADCIEQCAEQLVTIADLLDATGKARATLSDALAVAPEGLEIATMATADLESAKLAVRQARELLAAAEQSAQKPASGAPRPGGIISKRGKRRR